MEEKYYTLKEGKLTELPNPLKITIANPTVEQYKEFGYTPKRLIVEDEPEYDLGEEYLVAVYDENDDEIIQSWKIEKMAIEESEITEG